jgi:hypothetical protein
MMNFTTLKRIYYMAGILIAIPSLTLASHNEYNADSMKIIEEKFTGEPFLMVLWEINCLPCHEEMALIGKYRQIHPDMNIVMIGTDDISRRDDIDELLEKHGLVGIDSWLFAHPNIERLRYSIDPNWFGELPRNYIYDSDSSRIGFSGKLTEELLDEWLKLY